jgi:hypothetical protein
MTAGSPPGNIPFPIIPPSPFGLPPFHQVAIFMRTKGDVDTAVNLWKEMGVDQWHHDEPLYKGTIDGDYAECRGYLSFNYQILKGFELEFLTHEGASPWLELFENGQVYEGGFVSHMSSYVNDVEETANQLKDTIGPPYYIRETHDHQNPHVVGVKRFKEYIYDTRALLGFDIKTIQRIPWGEG